MTLDTPRTRRIFISVHEPMTRHISIHELTTRDTLILLYEPMTLDTLMTRLRLVS